MLLNLIQLYVGLDDCRGWFLDYFIISGSVVIVIVLLLLTVGLRGIWYQIMSFGYLNYLRPFILRVELLLVIDWV